MLWCFTTGSPQQNIRPVAPLFVWCQSGVKAFCSPLARGHSKALWLPGMHAYSGPSANLPPCSKRVHANQAPWAFERASTLFLSQIVISDLGCPLLTCLPLTRELTSGIRGDAVRWWPALPYQKGNVPGMAQRFQTVQRGGDAAEQQRWGRGTGHATLSELPSPFRPSGWGGLTYAECS